MEEYLSGSKACKVLGVHSRTLYNWDEQKLIETIRTPGGKRLYNVKKYLQSLEKNISKEDIKKDIKYKSNLNKVHREQPLKKKIIYARVSSNGQKDDLERQIELLLNKYPNYEIIKEIGSGMNMNRKGLRKVIDYAIEGKIEELVITYKDRLARFGYNLIEDLIKKYSNGKITILSETNKLKNPMDDLVQDVLQIMNIYVAKMNGLRKSKKLK